MDNNKPVFANIYDFKLKHNQIVNAVAFNDIFGKFLQNDESLMRVRDIYCYGPKTFQRIPDFYDYVSVQLSTDQATGEELSLYFYDERKYPDYAEDRPSPVTELSDVPVNTEWAKYVKTGYKVWQNINNTPSESGYLPGWRSQPYDVLTLRDIDSEDEMKLLFNHGVYDQLSTDTIYGEFKEYSDHPRFLQDETKSNVGVHLGFRAQTGQMSACIAGTELADGYSQTNIYFGPDDGWGTWESQEQFNRLMTLPMYGRLKDDPPVRNVYERYLSGVTTVPSKEGSFWESSFEGRNTSDVESAAHDYVRKFFRSHVNAYHNSVVNRKEASLECHTAQVYESDSDSVAVVISADLPQVVKKITNSEYCRCEVKNPYTFTQYYGHADARSAEFHDCGIVPTCLYTEYASGMKYIYVNLPTTKTFWLPFVVPTGLEYEDGYINFYNLPFNSSVYKSDDQRRNYFGIGRDTLYGCDETDHRRKPYTDPASGVFVTEFNVVLDHFNITKVYGCYLNAESPALNRVQFGYSQHNNGRYLKQHGGDNSYYPPSILVEEPQAKDGVLTVHGCCFGSDSQNIMVVCK